MLIGKDINSLKLTRRQFIIYFYCLVQWRSIFILIFYACFFRCDGCSSTYSNSNRGCCGKRGLTKIYNDDLTCIDLTAFVCGLCNYLQIDEKSMRKHLLNEHEIVGGIFDNQYDKIVLLPSVKKLNKRLM